MNTNEKEQYEDEKFALESFLKQAPIVQWKDWIRDKDRIIDFRFNTKQGIVGIELIGFSKDSGNEAERQAFYNSVIKKAKEIFEREDDTHLHVAVHFFHQEHIPPRKKKLLFSQAIADTLWKNLNRIKTLTSSEYIVLDLRINNKLEGKLHINNFGQEVESLWTRNNPYWVGTLSCEELQKIIDKKNDKFDNYKSGTDKTYLLIYSHITVPEEAVRFDTDLLKQQFYAKFDKVFFFDIYTKELHQLKITSVIE